MLEFVIPVWDVFPFFKIKVFKIKYATANTNNSITGTKLYLSGIIKPTILVTKNPKAQSQELYGGMTALIRINPVYVRCGNYVGSSRR